jgi:hypothetical protein
MEKKLIEDIVKKATLKHIPHIHPYTVMDLEKTLIETLHQALSMSGVSGCSEQWHVLSINMGDGKCSKCGKKLTELNYR